MLGVPVLQVEAKRIKDGSRDVLGGVDYGLQRGTHLLWRGYASQGVSSSRSPRPLLDLACRQSADSLRWMLCSNSSPGVNEGTILYQRQASVLSSQ